MSLLPKFITGNSSEVHYGKIEKHLEGCRKRDVRSKGYKFLTESYIPNRPSSRSGRKDCWINKYGVQNGAGIIQ